jgi:hypothetical protein
MLLFCIVFMSPTIELMSDVFANPPKTFDPVNQTLKGWAMFCLRDRGFVIVSFSPKSDFIVSSKAGDLLFNVTQDPDSVVQGAVGWIVVGADGAATVIAPEE